MAAKPTVLIVPGACVGSYLYHRLVSVFEKDGFPTVCNSLPGFEIGVPSTMYDDAKRVRVELDRLILGEGKDVVLLIHSYGGVVGSEASVEEYGKKFRAEKGLAGGIVRIIFLTAIILPVGVSQWATMKDNLPPLDIKDGAFWLKDNTLSFSDCTKEDTDHFVATMRPFPIACADSPLTNAGYKYHPVSYIFCEKDIVVPIAAQEAMVAASGVHFTSARIQSGHAPVINKPEEVLNAVKKLLE